MENWHLKKIVQKGSRIHKFNDKFKSVIFSAMQALVIFLRCFNSMVKRYYSTTPSIYLLVPSFNFSCTTKCEFVLLIRAIVQHYDLLKENGRADDKKATVRIFFQFNSWQFTVNMISKLKIVREFCFYLSFNLNFHITPYLPITRSGAC